MGRGLRHLPRPPQGAGRLSAGLAAAALAAASAAACLVTSPSEFVDPALPTPPFLSADDAEPKLSRFVLIDDPTATRRFSTTVRSQDNLDPLEARLYLDYPTNAQANLLDQREIAPGTLKDPDDRPRSVELEWRPSVAGPTVVTPGCHSITMMVSHGFQAIDVNPAVDGDVDFLVWWVYVPSGLFEPGGAGGQGGAAGQAGASGQAGAGGRFDTIERCLLLGDLSPLLRPKPARAVGPPNAPCRSPGTPQGRAAP